MRTNIIVGGWACKGCHLVLWCTGAQHLEIVAGEQECETITCYQPALGLLWVHSHDLWVVVFAAAGRNCEFQCRRDSEFWRAADGAFPMLTNPGWVKHGATGLRYSHRKLAEE